MASAGGESGQRVRVRTGCVPVASRGLLSALGHQLLSCRRVRGGRVVAPTGRAASLAQTSQRADSHRPAGGRPGSQKPVHKSGWTDSDCGCGQTVMNGLEGVEGAAWGSRAAVAGWSASGVSLEGVVEQRPGVGRGAVQVWGLPRVQVGLIPQFGWNQGARGQRSRGRYRRASVGRGRVGCRPGTGA